MGKDKGSLFKWKWLNHNTIDLLIKSPYIEAKDVLVLYCQGQDTSILWRRVRLTESQIASTKALVEKAQQARPDIQEIIVECGWVTETKSWIPRNLRLDKKKANYSSVCVSTLNTVIDDITCVSRM